MDELDTFLSSTPKPVNLVAELKQATKNEVFSPDILPFQKELVTNLLENVEQQQEVLDEIVKQHTHRQAVVNFQIELERYLPVTFFQNTETTLRTKYLIQHYLRVRIKKIQGSPSEKQKKIVPHKEFFNGSFGLCLFSKIRHSFVSSRFSFFFSFYLCSRSLSFLFMRAFLFLKSCKNY